MNNRELEKMLKDGDKSKWEVCYQIAEYYYEHNDYQPAFFWYEKAAALSDCNPIVYFEIGYSYQHGEGVKSDLIEAVKWYEKAAAEDVPQAFYNLAYFYQHGLVVDKDPEKALQMLKTATSSMHRLQVERYDYELWKEKSEIQLTELQKKTAVLRTQIDSLEEDKKQLSLQKSDVVCEKERLERMIEQLTNEYHSQMESRLKAAEDLITKIVRENNSSYENVQKSYADQINKLKESYEDELLNMQKNNENLYVQNAVLNQTIEEKMKEVDAIKEGMQLLQTQLGSETKRVRIVVVIAVLLIVALFILSLGLN